jgi:hypothetical protein
VYNPAIQSTVINHKATLRHHFFNIAIAERIRTVLSNTLKDSGFRCMAAFEGDHELLRYYS